MILQVISYFKKHIFFISNEKTKVIIYTKFVLYFIGLPDNLRASAAEKESNWSHWSIRTLFGIGITSACAVADSSKIFIDVTQNTFELLPENQESQEIVLKTEERTLKEFDVQKLVNAGMPHAVIDKNSFPGPHKLNRLARNIVVATATPGNPDSITGNTNP